MAGTSHIEWTQATWNPATGCSKVSEGCLNCYAERMTRRLQAMGVHNYRDGFDVVRCHDHMLSVPTHWKRPRMIFVNSMSDLFHPEVSEEFIRAVFDVMAATPQHIYQVLTKRAKRMSELDIVWPRNVWAGVTIENGHWLSRLHDLRKTRATVRFLSLEPLLGPLYDLRLDSVDWVIVGGESGPGARPIEENWVRDIRDVCRFSGTPFFFKQWGGLRRAEAGRRLDGRTWSQFPSTTGLSACVPA